MPTVVNLPNATERIPDGALVEVDGGSGEVRILEEPSGSEAAAAPADKPREVV